MDWGYKAMLTATTVALLLTVAPLLGRRAAGVLAGLPTVTGPALLWLALDHGTAYAAVAAVGSVAGCALCAVFAFAYERGSRRGGVVLALAVATTASVVATPVASALEPSLPLTVAAALVVVALLFLVMPDGKVARGPQRRGLRGEPFVTAGVAGLVSGAVALCAPELGPFWAGVLASPPLIAAVIAAQQHATDGAPAAAAFLRGYVGGLIGRIGFGLAFATLPLVMPLSLAALLAFVACCLLTAASLRALGRRAVPIAQHRLATRAAHASQTTGGITSLVR